MCHDLLDMTKITSLIFLSTYHSIFGAESSIMSNLVLNIEFYSKINTVNSPWPLNPHTKSTHTVGKNQPSLALNHLFNIKSCWIYRIQQDMFLFYNI